MELSVANATAAFEMVLSPGAGRTSAAGVQPPPGTERLPAAKKCAVVGQIFKYLLTGRQKGAIMFPPLRRAFLLCPGTCATSRTPCRPRGRYTVLAPAPAGEDKYFEWEVPIHMANEARVKVTLVCTECKQRNYDTKKNKKNDPDRLELKKYCKFCRKHTLHKESK